MGDSWLELSEQEPVPPTAVPWLSATASPHERLSCTVKVNPSDGARRQPDVDDASRRTTDGTKRTLLPRDGAVVADELASCAAAAAGATPVL